jgi:hypothetical protein
MWTLGLVDFVIECLHLDCYISQHTIQIKLTSWPWLATSRKNLKVLAIFFQTLIAKHTTIIFQTLSKKPTTLNSNLKLKFCGNAYTEQSSKQLYNNQPWTISLDNLKNKIETFISKLCFEIITNQMNKEKLEMNQTWNSQTKVKVLEHKCKRGKP